MCRPLRPTWNTSIPRNPLAVADFLQRGLRGGCRQGVKFTERKTAVLRQCENAVQARMADIYDRGRIEQ